MRIAVDEEGVAGLGAVVADVAASLGAVDLTAATTAVVDGMPGSLSAQVASVVVDLQTRLREVLGALEVEGGGLRLAAERYAAADRVAAAAGAAAADAATATVPAAETRATTWAGGH